MILSPGIFPFVEEVAKANTMYAGLDQKYFPQLKDRDWQQRKTAVDALGRAGHPSGIPPLIAALRDEMQVIRASAAEGLGNIGSASAVPALIRALKDDSKDFVRLAAAQALLRIGDSSTLPRKILADATLTERAKIEVLDSLRKLRYKDRSTTLRYAIPDIGRLCNAVSKEGDAASRLGAEAILNWLGSGQLLRSSGPGQHSMKSTLVRPVQTDLADEDVNTLPRVVGEVVNTPADN